MASCGLATEQRRLKLTHQEEWAHSPSMIRFQSPPIRQHHAGRNLLFWSSRVPAQTHGGEAQTSDVIQRSPYSPTTSVTTSERQSPPQASQLDPELSHPAGYLLKFDYEQVRLPVGLSPWQPSSRGQPGL